AAVQGLSHSTSDIPLRWPLVTATTTTTASQRRLDNSGVVCHCPALHHYRSQKSRCNASGQTIATFVRSFAGSTHSDAGLSVHLQMLGLRTRKKGHLNRDSIPGNIDASCGTYFHKSPERNETRVPQYASQIPGSAP